MDTTIKKSFKDFNITIERDALKGNKISINTIIGQQIEVERYKVEPSKFEGKSECLHMQIVFNGVNWVVFVSSPSLIEMIRKVPASGFPFCTKISKDSGCLQFT